MGPYVLDFACMKARLVIEVDGGQHAVSPDRDERRTVWLQSQGYRVLRFWNNDVLEQLEGILETIRDALLIPPPQPSPQGGGSNEGH
jgi:very-short-patch-repair endonuclease